MNDWVYPRERTLGRITLVLGLLVWLLLIVGTFGAALLVLLLGFVIYVFAQSAFIAYIRGNGVEITAQQFPDLAADLEACCTRLQLSQRPQAYVLQGGGHLNAFATRFLGTEFVVLLSDTVDAMREHPDGLRFYTGHELGHLRMKHLRGNLLRWPVLWLPLLGAAYSRARESTCDRHGAACCATPENAARALAALAAGGERWKTLNFEAFREQLRYSRGFWMSFHELNAGYPWLTKRVARVLAPEAALPGRNGLAYVFSAFVPFAGRLGGGFGLLILVYVLGVLAAVAIPAYKDYQTKAQLSQAMTGSQPVREALAAFYAEHETTPDTLADVQQPERLADGSSLSLNSENMVLTVGTARGELIFTPKLNAQGQLFWLCEGGEGVAPKQLPASCKSEE